MEDFEWSVQHECHLLESMMGHKPVGINKWFQMFLIYDKFIERVDKELLSKLIWKHLETMYNLEALDENESIPFPNNESEFELPDLDFASLKELKLEEKKNIQKGRETPKMIKDVKKEEKTPVRNTKDVQRRDSKDNNKITVTAKKETKKEPEKQAKSIKNRRSSNASKEDTPKANNKSKNDESTPRAAKRPTRASLKPDDTGSGKASPVTIATQSAKRRRI